MKRIAIIALALALSAGAFAEEATKVNAKIYGFVRTYFAFDTRDSNAGTEDLFYYMPNPESLNDAGNDVNAVPTMRFAALTSRLGVNISGGEVLGYKLGGKIETDFYSLAAPSSTSSKKVSGTAQLRLRQAFATVEKNGRSWKIGQAWHPMAADLPDIFSLDSGVPFAPFSRTPLVNFNWNFAGRWTLNTSAIWQMQYTSTGPLGAVADYMRYSCTPEMYVGVTCGEGANLFRLAADFVSIKPRNFTSTGTKASDRLTTWNLFFYGQQRLGNWDSKLKVVYANDGSHINMVGGYGISGVLDDGSYTYSATRNLSAWATFSRKVKDCPWVPQIFLGYCKMFGTSEDILAAAPGGEKVFYEKLNASTVAGMWRIQPEILYNLGKLSIGAEYMLTGVNYGRSTNARRQAQDIYSVANHRIQMMVKYTF